LAIVPLTVTSSGGGRWPWKNWPIVQPSGCSKIEQSSSPVIERTSRQPVSKATYPWLLPSAKMLAMLWPTQPLDSRWFWTMTSPRVMSMSLRAKPGFTSS
jgi:hypothetical protein